MKKLSISLIAASILATGAVNAADIMIDTGDASLDNGAPLNSGDADSITSLFEAFGFGGLSATSLYELDGVNGNLTGKIIDTNIDSELTGFGIPDSGTARDGSTFVSITNPGCTATAGALSSNAECDIDELQPLVPPFGGGDSEGFLLNWDFQVKYHLEATLGGFGPVYDSGYIELWLNDFADDTNDRKVLRAEVVNSVLSPANLAINTKIVWAETGFLAIDNGSSFVDAGTLAAGGFFPDFQLNTNVAPPIPTDDQLLNISTGLGGAGTGDNYAVRQTNLNGFLVASIPEPTSIALLGLGLLGLGGAARRKK